MEGLEDLKKVLLNLAVSRIETQLNSSDCSQARGKQMQTKL